MTVLAATATARGHVSPGVIVLIIAAAVLVWLGSLFVKPYTSCSWCQGTGRRGTRARYGHCWRCKGEPERRRFGARLVHRNLGDRKR